GSILQREANKVIVKTQKATKGKLTTYQCDGWKNIAKTALITSMMQVDYIPYLIRTHDMTGRPKTGDELFALIKDDILYTQNTYGVKVICVTTDDGPDGKKARRLIKEDLNLAIAVFECWAHQSSLMSGNYLAIKVPFMKAASKALEIIKWFNNHQKALDILRAEELTHLQHILALILPVITRWTAFYCALARLLTLQSCIVACVAHHQDALLAAAGTKDDTPEKAAEIVEMCEDRQFWKDLKMIASHLEPLAIAANIFQAPTCRLDHVLLTLGNLFSFFDSMESTYKLFILAVFFNPYIRAKYFNREKLSIIALFHILRRAFLRLMKQSSQGDIEFMRAFQAYYDGTGTFSDNEMWLDGWLCEYGDSDDGVNLVDIWSKMGGPSTAGASGFCQLAIRVLSMVPNSAATECTFSTYGNTHTKTRNRINHRKVHDSTLVRMDRKRAHGEAGMLYKRKKRKFALISDNTDDGDSEHDTPTFDSVARDLIEQAQDDEWENLYAENVENVENVDLADTVPAVPPST
ncbi:ribonuclease H-like domain-containing protein, partial [Flammula alnicola]